MHLTRDTKCLSQQLPLWISCTSPEKSFQSNSEQKKVVQNFISAFRLLKISKKNITFGFLGIMKDFEDAVQAGCAKMHLMNLIITRNVKDFINSPIEAITPEDFIKHY